MTDAAASPAPSLPAVQQATLDADTLESLFRDLAHCTQILAVVPKTASHCHVQERSIDLASARAGLVTGTYRAVQIRYRYAGQEWCDTLLTSPSGIRLVRVCTDDVLASGPSP